MWRGRSRATVKAWLVDEASNTPGIVNATKVHSAKRCEVRTVRDIGIARIDRGPVVKLGIYNNIGLVVSRPGEEVSPLFTHVIGKAEIGVAIAGVNFEAAKSVNQHNVKNTINRVTAVDGGSAVL